MNPKKPNPLKSPIKNRPLRLPGESVDEEIGKAIDESLYPYLFAIVISWVVFGLEISRLLLPSSPSPGVYFVGTLAITVVGVWRVARIRQRIQRLRLARSGERAVGQHLERLRESGIHVFHDIPGDGFNVDHVLVGKQGIFAVETKTFSKPTKGKADITYSDGTLFANGHKIERDPIVQAHAAAKWLTGMLQESTGHTLQARPVVLFPGWWVDPLPPKEKQNIWILEPKALPAFIEHSPAILSYEDVKSLSFHLSRYVRINNTAL